MDKNKTIDELLKEYPEVFKAADWCRIELKGKSIKEWGLKTYEASQRFNVSQSDIGYVLGKYKHGYNDQKSAANTSVANTSVEPEEDEGFLTQMKKVTNDNNVNYNEILDKYDANIKSLKEMTIALTIDNSLMLNSATIAIIRRSIDKYPVDYSSRELMIKCCEDLAALTDFYISNNYVRNNK